MKVEAGRVDGHNADDRLRELAKASLNFGRLYGHQPLLAVYGSQRNSPS